MNVLCLVGRATWLAAGWDLTQAFPASDVSQAERHVRRPAKAASLERGEE